MTERKPFLLRLDPVTMEGLRAWAADDLRSLNGQIEYLLRRSLRDAGRLPASRERREAAGPPSEESDTATSDARERSDPAAVEAMDRRSDLP